MRVAILLACVNRNDQLRRSLYTLSRQTMPADVFVVDDGSLPGVDQIALEAGVYYERIREPVLPEFQTLRGPVPAWRHIYDQTDHEFVIISHPEVLVPFDAVERMLNQHQSPRRSTPLLYFLTKPHCDQMDSLPWREDVHVVQSMPGFLGVYNRWNVYNYDMKGWAHHVCFTGQTREDWDLHNFIPTRMEVRTGDDAWLWMIEDKLSHETGENHRVNQIELVVYHQFHETTPSSAPPNDTWLRQNYGELILSGGHPNVSARVRRILQTMEDTK